MLILDTHVLIWMVEGSSRLGKSALKRIDEALAIGQLGVATISFWETAMLVEKGRISIQTDLEIWRTELLQAGIIEIPLVGTHCPFNAISLHSTAIAWSYEVTSVCLKAGD